MPKKRKKNIMFKKIHFGYSLVFILVLSVVPLTLYLFLILGAIGTNQASAAAGSIFGGRITKVIPCVLDTPAIAPTTCAVSCPLCTGITGTACAAYSEIMFQPMGGTWSFICPLKGYPFKGGTPRPGGLILGTGISQSILTQVGVSR